MITHRFDVGDLVELDTGERLRVMQRGIEEGSGADGEDIAVYLLGMYHWHEDRWIEPTPEYMLEGVITASDC